MEKEKEKEKGGERWRAAVVNLSEMASNLESLQKILTKKAVFVDEDTFTKASLSSEQSRTIKTLEQRVETLERELDAAIAAAARARTEKRQAEAGQRAAELRAQDVTKELENTTRHLAFFRELLHQHICRGPKHIPLDLEEKVDNLETNHFVLVHGGGFGAWCWYKTIALLEDNGFKVNAIDLTGSGIHSFDTNNITSLAQYVKPLTNFLEKLVDGVKVILVGHDFGGACISYAMEVFPTKVAKAVFVTASMLTNGQSTLDMFSQQDWANDVMRQAQIFIYANGNDQPPTAFDLDKSLLKDLLFNQSPVKDIALASVSMRPIPFAPVLEKLSLTGKNYGSVRRFYIETSEDNAMPLSLQQAVCDANPPEKVFRLKGSDHSPFFSKPQALHKLLVEIAKIPPNQAEQPTGNQDLQATAQ